MTLEQAKQILNTKPRTIQEIEVYKQALAIVAGAFATGANNES